MKLTKTQVKHVAKLANLPIEDLQIEEYSDQLSKILDYIDQLDQVDISNVLPTYNVSGQNTVMREDEAIKSLSQEEALQNAANSKNGFFVTKGVFKEE